MNIIEGGLSFNLMIYYNSSFSNGDSRKKL